MVCKFHAGAWSREGETTERSRTEPSVRTITTSDRCPDPLTSDVRAPLTGATLQPRLPDVLALGAARWDDEHRRTDRRRPLVQQIQVRQALLDRQELPQQVRQIGRAHV